MVLGKIGASLAAALLILVVAGCGGRPTGVLVPIGTPNVPTNTVDMLVATTRMQSPNRGEMFTGERALQPSFAEIVVSIPQDKNRKVGDVQWPDRLPGNPEKNFETVSATIMDRDEVRSRFHQMIARSPHRQVLVFVHGFNNRFDDAVYRFAQIVHDSKVKAVPALFTWPSRGSVWAYGYDRESANYSRDALELLLQTLSKDPSVGEIAILAHSMGNWVALEALRQMAIRDGRVNKKINAVMLAAPDVDVNVFRTQLMTITAVPGPKITLFVSQDDRALAFSRRVWGDIPRLGAINPELEPYKAELAADKISVIDLTKLASGDRMNHGKFAESPEVVQLIGARLSTGQPITDSHVGLGDRIAGVATGAAATVGSAAGAVLSAPIAIVDPDTRNNLGDHFNNIGASVSDTAKGATQ